MQEHFQQNPDIAWRTLDGEAVLVKPEEGMMLILNEVGTVLWESCEQSRSLEELTHKLQERFEVNRDVASKDTQEFIAMLLEKKCLLKH